jgi:hypothetical protein
MMWAHKSDRGNPQWSGQDTIRDFNWHRRVAVGCAAPVAAVLGLLVLAVMVSMLVANLLERPWAASLAPSGRVLLFGFLTVIWGAWAVVGSGVITALVGGVVLWQVTRGKRAGRDTSSGQSGFFVRAWTLRGDEAAGRLSYQAADFSPALDPEGDGESWEIPVDSVARVEVGRTAEWQARRAYPYGPVYSQGRDESGVFFSDGTLAVPQEEYQTYLFLNNGVRVVVATMHNGREDAMRLAASVRAWIDAQRQRGLPSAPASDGGPGFDF